MTLIERAARALVGDHPDRPWESLSPEAQARWMGAARAVIEEIREPDDQMIAALWPDEDGHHMLRPADKKQVAVDGWRAMIDAALA